MKREKLPAMPWYVADTMNDEAVKLMSNREFGVYMKLLGSNWTEGSIPGDLASLACLVHESVQDFQAIWNKIQQKFRHKGGRSGATRLTNSRVEKERKKRFQYVRKQSRAMSEFRAVQNTKSYQNRSAPSEASLSTAYIKPQAARARISLSLSSSLNNTSTPLPPLTNQQTELLAYLKITPPLHQIKDPDRFVRRLTERFDPGHVMTGLRAIMAWLAKNPTREDGMKDWQRFIVNWLNRDSDMIGNRAALAGLGLKTVPRFSV